MNCVARPTDNKIHSSQDKIYTNNRTTKIDTSFKKKTYETLKRTEAIID